MLISLPRTAWISSQEIFSKSRPLKRMDPSIFPGRIGNQPQNAERRDALAGSRLTHQADHFARKNVEVHAIDGLGGACLRVEIGLQIPNLQEWGLCCAHRSLENSLGSKASRTASPMKTINSNVTNIAARGKKTSHHFVRFSTPCADQLAPAGRGSGKAKAQKVQRHQRADVGDHHERREGDDRRERVRQNMLEDDGPVGSADGNGRRDVVLGLLTVKFTAHIIGNSHPVERRQDHDQQPKRRLQNQISSGKVNRHDDRADDDDGVEERQRRPYFDQALARDIHFAAEITTAPLRSSPR